MTNSPFRTKSGLLPNGDVFINVDEIHADMDLEHWSGHGEGGTLAKVVIRGWPIQDIYNSTALDIKTASSIRDFINTLLKNWQPPVSK